MNANEAMAELFNDSLERCKQNKQFIEKFYTRFFRSDSSVAAYFARTDMQRQMEMLDASLNVMMIASCDDNISGDFLTHIAAVHHQRKIPGYLYDKWLESLVDTVKEVDTKFNPSIEDAWRSIMKYGINFMKSYK